MEIIEEDDEEIKQLMLRISNKEITLCDSCDTFFDYVPQKNTCDECQRARRRAYARRKYRQRPEVKERQRKRKREYEQRPEVKERKRKREYRQRPEVKERERKRKQTPEYKEQRRKYHQRPEVKERQRKHERKYRQRPEVKERRLKRQRERYHRKKKLREEEWFLLDAQVRKRTN